MSWYKLKPQVKKFQVMVVLLTVLMTSCSQTAEQRPPSDYFDLKTYFASEVTRLKARNPSVSKTVSVDETTEQKELKIEDWEKELSAFSDADINKAAWRGLFTVEKVPGLERYTSNDEKAAVKSLIIRRSADAVTSIHITIKNKNALYTSVDELTYYPDSVYEINKVQKINFADPKIYKVKGRFINAALPLPVPVATAPAL